MLTKTHHRQSMHRSLAAASTRAEFSPSISVSPYFRWKTAIDRFLALVLLIPGLPLMFVLVLAVRGTSRGPAIFRQIRVGRGGRTFTMYKIRTMVHDAENRTGPVWAAPNDPRTTRLGGLLRKMHLDEVPQIWNVLKGEMSLVGPRPERPEFTHRLAQQVPDYLDRLAIPPGVTGLAQVNLPPDTNLDSVRRKLILDLKYVEQAGLLLDLRLIIYSGLRLMFVPGPVLIPLLRLRIQAELPTSPNRDYVRATGHPEDNGCEFSSNGKLTGRSAPATPVHRPR